MIIWSSRISCGTSPSCQNKQRFSCNCGGRRDLHFFNRSGGMLSTPGALPLDKWSMALLSFSMVRTESSLKSWFEGNLEFQEFLKTRFSDESKYQCNVPPVCPFPCFFLAIFYSTNRWFRELIFFWNTGFYMLSYIPRIFPVFAAYWIFWLSWTHNLFAHLLAVFQTFFLKALSGSRFFELGTLIYWYWRCPECLYSVTGIITVFKCQTNHMS